MGIFFNKKKNTEIEEVNTPKEITTKEYEELQAKYNALEEKYKNSKSEYEELSKNLEELKKQEYEIKKIVIEDKTIYYCEDKDRNTYKFDENDDSVFSTSLLAKNYLAKVLSDTVEKQK